ncbi:MAG: cobalamin B12-binding domain-containing protein [Desulfarculus sp.]|nr:cobalamin B12-binding domain-containing protein [Pseudomonadota bacterium]MBU4596416.1 cobalamin B12-binding domain-containing protein [Pseudomonadota bacterium]MBV1716068.1 cobalamin B12-binding domain-containing protein [Desulfarculus sp.]MBV1738505.1 cobalamin B12-binding domain-containing protein [Desulfarculus sp.]
MPKRHRIMLAKAGLDGHDRGVRVVAMGLRDANFEVIYTGRRQTPEHIVNAAIQEDVDAIGLSILSGAHMTLFAKILELLKAKEADDIVVFGGGIIPPDDAQELKQMGVKHIFGPGTAMDTIVGAINQTLEQREAK